MLAFWLEARGFYSMLVEYATYDDFFRFELTGPDILTGCYFPRVPRDATRLPECEPLDGWRLRQLTPSFFSPQDSKTLRNFQRLQRGIQRRMDGNLLRGWRSPGAD